MRSVGIFLPRPSTIFRGVDVERDGVTVVAKRYAGVFRMPHPPWIKASYSLRSPIRAYFKSSIKRLDKSAAHSFVHVNITRILRKLFMRNEAKVARKLSVNFEVSVCSDGKNRLTIYHIPLFQSLGDFWQLSIDYGVPGRRPGVYQRGPLRLQRRCGGIPGMQHPNLSTQYPNHSEDGPHTS